MVNEFINKSKGFPSSEIITEGEEHLIFRITNHKNIKFGYVFIFDTRNFGYLNRLRGAFNKTQINDIFEFLNEEQKKFVIYNLDLFNNPNYKYSIFTTVPQSNERK